MIILLGGSGFIGQAFCRIFEARGTPYRSVSRSVCDYYDDQQLLNLLISTGPSLLVNAAGYTGKPNVDGCELHKAESLLGNAVLPGILRRACEQVNIPLGHISSGCIYTGCRPDGSGFREEDEPNFCFRTNNCSFYSGSKALGEEVLEGMEQCYQWRLRIPFNHLDSPRNYLSKLMTYDRLLDVRNSLTELDEFVSACIHCWEYRIPYGTYNLTNPGSVTTREVVDMIRSRRRIDQSFRFFESEEEFMKLAAKTPRSNCVLNTSKAQAMGIPLSEIHDAIDRALKRWQPAVRLEEILA